MYQLLRSRACLSISTQALQHGIAQSVSMNAWHHGIA